MASRTKWTVESASNFVRRRLRYHLMVGRLRHSSSAIWGLVRPSAMSLRMCSSFEVRRAF